MTEIYAANPEARRAYGRRHRVENFDKIRASDVARYERDKDKRISLVEASGHVRRARRAQVPFESGITRNALRKRDGDLCVYCGVEMSFERAAKRVFQSHNATIEHRLPLARGGKHVWDNVVLACRECNLSKNQKTEAEFLEYRRAIVAFQNSEMPEQKD
jgi:hypothetical protein